MKFGNLRCIRWLVLFPFLFADGATCFSQELPIKRARTISFTTEEGSYMSVDVSPDGKTLLFDLLGDIYSVPAVGGDATQLTRGVALNLRPIWSPDGKRMAYISDISGAFHLNVKEVGGTFHLVLGKSDKQLDDTQDAVWTPEGNFVAIGGFIYGLAGGNTPPNASITNPLRFSADGQFVYYLDSGRIYQYDYAKKIRSAISIVSQTSRNEVLSPDGRFWAYVADSNAQKCLIVRDLLSGREKIVVDSLLGKDPSYGDFTTHYAFSPDSKKIYIGYGGKIHCIDVERGSDRVIPFRARIRSDLGPFDYNIFRVGHDSLRVRYTRSANTSPDGKYVVFTALDKLYVMALPNGKAYPLAPQSINQFQPVYSPDGKWIAYTSWNDTAGGFLWRVPSSGGLPEQLTTIPGQYQRPAWSPDGTLIAVVRGDPKLGNRDDWGRGQLEIIPVNGGPKRVIDEGIPLWNQLDFTSDGSRVIYSPNHDLRYSKEPSEFKDLLVSNGVKGGDLREVAISKGFDFCLEQKRFSPDGRYMVYLDDEDLYLVPLCRLIEPQVVFDESQNLSVIRFATGVDPYWEKGGKVLSWSYGNRFYSVNPDKIVATAEKGCSKRWGVGIARRQVYFGKC